MRVIKGNKITKLLPWTGLIARYVMATIWIVAGVLKAIDPAETTRAVRAYKLLPENLVTSFAYALPFVEIGLGILLVVGLGIRITSLCSSLLLIVFIFGVSTAWARGLQIECGCFGGGGNVAPGASKYLQDIFRDILFVFISSWGILLPNSKYSLDSIFINNEEFIND